MVRAGRPRLYAKGTYIFVAQRIGWPRKYYHMHGQSYRKYACNRATCCRATGATENMLIGESSLVCQYTLSTLGKLLAHMFSVSQMFGTGAGFNTQVANTTIRSAAPVLLSIRWMQSKPSAAPLLKIPPGASSISQHITIPAVVSDGVCAPY